MSIKTSANVNVSVANIYHKPTFHCEIDSQAILWEKLEILDEENDFVLVKTEDQYQGWIHAQQIIITDKKSCSSNALITERQTYFYEQPDTNTNKMRDGFAGMQLPIISEKRGWIQTEFPDSQEGWIKSKSTGTLKRPNSLELLNYAESLIGVPYLWGGKTVRGFDCSGYIQFVHKMFNINLRRDAWMQFEDSSVVSKNYELGKPGDLMFFSEDGHKIAHVGFCYKPGFVLHCQGIVKINSLNKGDTLFNEKLLKDFVEIKTFLE